MIVQGGLPVLSLEGLLLLQERDQPPEGRSAQSLGRHVQYFNVASQHGLTDLQPSQQHKHTSI